MDQVIHAFAIEAINELGIFIDSIWIQKICYLINKEKEKT